MRKLHVVLLLVAATIVGLGVSLYLHGGPPPDRPYGAWQANGPKHTLDFTEFDPNAPMLLDDEILTAPDFVFTMGVGSGKEGLDVFRIDAEGNAAYIFSATDETWWKATFKVSPEMLARLRQTLIDSEFTVLQRAYDAGAEDGTQWCIRVDAAGATQKVYCNNYFPESAVRLADLIGKDLLPAHDDAMKRATRIWASTAKKAAEGLW